MERMTAFEREIKNVLQDAFAMLRSPVLYTVNTNAMIRRVKETAEKANHSGYGYSEQFLQQTADRLERRLLALSPSTARL